MQIAQRWIYLCKLEDVLVVCLLSLNCVKRLVDGVCGDGSSWEAEMCYYGFPNKTEDNLPFATVAFQSSHCVSCVYIWHEVLLVAGFTPTVLYTAITFTFFFCSKFAFKRIFSSAHKASRCHSYNFHASCSIPAAVSQFTYLTHCMFNLFLAVFNSDALCCTTVSLSLSLYQIFRLLSPFNADSVLLPLESYIS